MEASIYRMRQQDVLTICVLALLSLGAVMVQSASSGVGAAVIRAVGPNLDPQHAPPPGPDPLNDVIAVTNASGIELSWAYASDPTVTSYRIYRCATERGKYSLLETVKKPGTRYKDTTAVIGEPTYYRVAPVDDLGRQGKTVLVAVVRPGTWEWSQLGTRHILFVLLAFGTFLVIGHIRYTKLASADRLTHNPLKSPVLWALAIAALSCVAVLAPGIGTSVNGARRWIKLGPIQVQPSELAKWAAVLFLAWWLTRPSTKTQSFLRGFLPAVIPVAGLCLLVVIQDFGTAALIAVCAFTMLLAGKVRPWHVAIVILPAALGGAWFIMHKEYRLRRIMAFRDPYASPQGEGYHMIQSLLSFSTGGVLGRGLGNGIQKLGYLPEDTTDFIFAVICEELGLFGAMLTVVLYLGVIYVAWQAIKHKRDDFGRMLAFGIGSMLGLQAAINIAVATVSVPTKGLSLPLISAGGSGLIITCAALGVLYSVTHFAPDAVLPLRTGKGSQKPEARSQNRFPLNRPVSLAGG
jgi:cell division protein FtsW